MLRLKLLDRSLCLIQVFALNSNALYPEIVKETSEDLKGFKLSNT